jgi:hypothetical protein
MRYIDVIPTRETAAVVKLVLDGTITRKIAREKLLPELFRLYSARQRRAK